jgi:hypothetical protein
MVSVSAGDGGLLDSGTAQPDLGTGFAVSTNILNKNQLAVAGMFGSSPELGPSAMGICAVYSRDSDLLFAQAPEVTLTVSQVGTAAPQIAGSLAAAQQFGAAGSNAVIRTMSVGIYQVMEPTEGMHLEYGMTAQAVDYLQHVSRISPFARLTVDLGAGTQAIASYSDGGRPNQLLMHDPTKRNETGSRDEDLTEAANSLARLPQLSERDGALRLQRTRNYEVGLLKTASSTTYAVSAFYQHVDNGRIDVAGDLSPLNSGDLFWDGISKVSAYNIGSYDREGFLASVNRQLTDDLGVTVAYGRMGGFSASSVARPQSIAVSNGFLDERNRNMASANIRAVIPFTGTRLNASYGWVDTGTYVPRHTFTTQSGNVAPGVNVELRQPLPSLFGMAGRLELTADLRNLLAQGYLGMNSGDGQRLIIVQSPRVIRGGLNFIF